MAIITRDFLMTHVSELKPCKFHVAEWGGDILIERARARKVATYRERLAKENEEDTIGLGFIIAFCVNEDGTPLFTEADREWLGNQSASVINSIVSKIVEINGFRKEEQDEAEKNSEKADS